MCPVISTLQAKEAATETVTKELTEWVAILLALATREEKQAKLDYLKANAHKETQNFLAVTAKREKQHAEFMNHMLPKMNAFKEEVKIRKPHDFSKDDLFFYSAASFFDGKVKSDALKKYVFEVELVRHYTLESHHPEWEKYNDGECTELDILEMAVDRLARNVQFGDGTIHMDVLKKFLPVFTKGDNKAKQDKFLGYCQQYRQFVQDEFLAMFPDAKDWPKEPQNE